MWNTPQSGGHYMVDIHIHNKSVHWGTASDGWKLEWTFSSYLPGTHLGICASHLTVAFGSLGLKILFLRKAHLLSGDTTSSGHFGLLESSYYLLRDNSLEEVDQGEVHVERRVFTGVSCGGSKLSDNHQWAMTASTACQSDVCGASGICIFEVKM